ncbi:MFS transporter [Nocardia jinanensis]|uniref:MFS-type transporter YceJ n=1 Tax=Nocardia jinanensis TaxID=382504 RepID=A0A917RMU7_9NOCA|nr:MFS transporter [Nocardia jinanensis]GGL16208.1 putative MFS-type transporter YceJ [Nocardia jinanensis]
MAAESLPGRVEVVDAGQFGTPWGRHAMVSMLFFLLGAEMFVLSPLIPLLATEFGTTTPVAAMSVSAFAVTYAAASPLIGALSDGSTRKAAIVGGAIVFVGGELLCAAAPRFEFLLMGRVLAGLGAALMGPAVWSYVTETAAPPERGRAVSRVSAFFAAGQILGVPAGALVADNASWRWVFAAVGLAASAVILLIGLKVTGESRIPPRGRRAWSVIVASAGLWKSRDFTLVVSANFFAQAARYATYTFAGALLLSRFGFDTIQLGLIGAAVGTGSMIGALLAGYSVDIFHRAGRSQFALNVGYASVMALALFAATSSETVWISVFGWVITFAAGSAYVSTSQEYLTATMGDLRAPAVAWNNSALYAGTATGTFLLGMTELRSTSFTVLAVSFSGVAVLLSGSVMLCQHRARPIHGSDALPGAADARP